MQARKWKRRLAACLLTAAGAAVAWQLPEGRRPAKRQPATWRQIGEAEEAHGCLVRRHGVACYQLAARPEELAAAHQRALETGRRMRRLTEELARLQRQWKLTRGAAPSTQEALAKWMIEAGRVERESIAPLEKAIEP